MKKFDYTVLESSRHKLQEYMYVPKTDKECIRKILYASNEPLSMARALDSITTHAVWTWFRARRQMATTVSYSHKKILRHVYKHMSKDIVIR